MGVEDELKQKLEELASLQQSFDEFVESSKELESELEHELQEAQKRFHELEKKHSDVESKYRQLHESWNQLSKENKAVQAEVQKLREKVMASEITKRTLENENEELSNQLRILEATEEDLRHKLTEAEEDIVYLKTDIEELKSIKKELEQAIEQQRDRKIYAKEGFINNTEPSIDCVSPKPDFGVDTISFNEVDTEMQLQEKTRMVDELEQKVEDLSQLIHTLEVENDKLHEELQTAIKSRGADENERINLQKMEEIIGELRKELEEERQRSEDNDYRLAEIEKEKDELAEENRQLLDLKDETQRLESAHEVLKEKEAAARREMEKSHQMALHNLETMLKTKSDELLLLQNSLSSAEKALADQNDSVIITLQEQIECLSKDLKNQREYAGTILEEKDLLFQSLTGMKLLMEEKDREIEQLQETVGENNLHFEQEKERVSRTYDQQIEALETKIHAFRISGSTENPDPVDENESLKAKIDEILSLRAVLLAKEEECNEKASEVKMLQEAIQKVEDQYKLEKASVMREMTGKLDAVMSELAKLKESGADGTLHFDNRTSNSSERGSIGSHISFKDVYSGRFDSTTSNMKHLQQILAGNDIERLKRELVNLAEHCESLKSNNIKLLNKIQAVRGNILVCCRTRPPNENEVNAGGVVIVDASDDTELLCYDGRSESWKSFAFDRVWKSESNQADIFSDIEPLVLSVTDGYNSCIMAYGQTGSGKTYTMDGYDEQYGVSYRTIQKIFDILEGKKSQLYLNKYRGSPKGKLVSPYPKASPIPPTPDSSHKRRKSGLTDVVNSRKISGSMIGEENYPPIEAEETPEEHDNSTFSVGSSFSVNEQELPFKYWVELSMMEIYNEQVYDLLNDNIGGGQTDGAPLDIRQTPDNTVSVPGLKQVPVTNIEDVMLVFGKGSANRATAATNMNERSSRSHLIIQVEVTIEQEGESQTKGKLFLVDLAGSERVGKSGATGTTMKEAQYINKSLLALGDVMEALDQKQKHIPYRNSKLTFLLQNALGGSARTMMIVTVCPTDLTFEETLFTLQFATRVRNITLGAAQRNSNSKNLEICVKNLRSELKEVKRKKATLDETISELRREQKRAQDRTTAPLEAKVKLLEESKKSLELVVNQLQRQLNDALVRLHEEREAKETSRSELELTQRNLKKALEQAKEHVLESERFSALLKNKERELESVKSALLRHINTGGKGVGTPSTAEKQSKVAFQLNNSGNLNQNEKYHPRLESEISTPLHAVKKTRFGEDDYVTDIVGNEAPLDDNASTSSTQEERVPESGSSEVMGPPHTVDASKSRSTRSSGIPTSLSRLSTGSGSGSSSVLKSRDQSNSKGGNTGTPTQSTNLRTSSNRPPFNNSTSLTIKKTSTSKLATPQSYNTSANTLSTPVTPNARLQPENAPATPNAPPVVQVSTRPPVTVVNAGATDKTISTSVGTSKIPTVAARSEEALKRHQLRMEKRRSAMEAKK